MILLLARLQHKRGIHKTYFSILLSLYLKSIHYLQWGSIKIRVCGWDVQPVLFKLNPFFHCWLEMEYNSGIPPIYLHLIFEIFHSEISSLMNWIFFLVWTGFSACCRPVKFKFDIDLKRSSSNMLFQTREYQKSNADR